MENDFKGLWVETVMTPDMSTEGVSAFNMPPGTKCLVNIFTAAVLVPEHPTNKNRVLTLHSGRSNLPLPDVSYDQVKEAIRKTGTLVQKP